MQSDDSGDASEVDFVVGPDDPGEELLPEPAERPMWRNPLLVAGLAVALALIVVGGVRLAGRGTGTNNQPQAMAHRPHAEASVAPLPHVFGGPAIAAHLGPEPDVIVAPRRLRVCPDASHPNPGCSITYRLPREVRAALRDHLPGVRKVHGFEEQLHYVGNEPGGLWYRQVYGRFGALTVTITVARQHIPQPVEVLMLPQYVGFSYHGSGFYVRTLVHVHGPQLVPILRLMALTRDARLWSAV